MPALSVSVPFPVFQDRDGQPLDNGYVYIGTVNLDAQTNPVQVYFDEALTIPAAQPLRTINGYVSNAGTPAQLYVNAVNFSIKLLDAKGTFVYSFNNGTQSAQGTYTDWIADTFTGNGVQTLFVLERAPGSVGNCDVSVNGLTLVPNTEFSLSGAILTFVTAPANGATILVRYGAAATQISATFSTESQTATAGQTVFSLNDLIYDPGTNALAVYVNGLRMVSGIDFLETSTEIVTFTSGLTLGDEVLFISGRTINESIGAEAVSYLPGGTGAVATTVQAKLRESVSVFDFMTAAEIADAQAYTFGVNVTVAVQAAMDAAFAAKCNLFCPAGGYLVTGLTLPGTYTSPDTRSWSFRLYGQGCGIPFTTSYTGSTVFKSVTDAPVITDNTIVSANSNCSLIVDNIKFDGSSTTPVVLLNSMYGVSEFHHNTIYQRSTGDGFKLLYGATCHIHDCYSFNSDFVSFGLGSARTGVGFNFVTAYAAGLVGFSKCTSRGFKDGFILNGAGGSQDAYSVSLRDFECSVVYNGVTIGPDVVGAVVDNGYFEGGDNGTAILIQSPYSTITNNRIFPGFLVGIDSASTANLGGVSIHDNLVNLGTKVNAIGISLSSTGDARNQNACNNTIVYTGGTAGVNGIKITGVNPRINVFGNYFEPGNTWTGAGSIKINDASVDGIFGILQKESGTSEIVSLSRGEISLFTPIAALTQADVSGNILTLPAAGSSLLVSATGAATVNRFVAGVTPGRVVVFRTTTANMTFTNSAYIKTAAAANFTGPGTITFLIDRVGAANYAYEIARTVF